MGSTISPSICNCTFISSPFFFKEGGTVHLLKPLKTSFMNIMSYLDEPEEFKDSPSFFELVVLSLDSPEGEILLVPA